MHCEIGTGRRAIIATAERDLVEGECSGGGAGGFGAWEAWLRMFCGDGVGWPVGVEAGRIFLGSASLAEKCRAGHYTATGASFCAQSVILLHDVWNTT